MFSMTGFGRGEAERDGYKFVVDIKSVNGKFLDVSIKAPKFVLAVEDKLRKLISDKLSRGSVELFVNISRGMNSAKKLAVDFDLAKQILSCSSALREEFGLQENITTKDLLRFNGVVVEEEEEIAAETLELGLLEALSSALSALVEMREKEGLALKVDLFRKAEGIQEKLNEVKLCAGEVVVEYHEKLKERVAELLKEVQIDDAKLANEVAFFADKADINEEIVRLDSHLVQFNNLLSSREPVGKKLEFLSQEMTREINTMGSKANSINITNLVLDMKNLNESIKEQIRNVE